MTSRTKTVVVLTRYASPSMKIACRISTTGRRARSVGEGQTPSVITDGGDEHAEARRDVHDVVADEVDREQLRRERDLLDDVPVLEDARRRAHDALGDRDPGDQRDEHRERGEPRQHLRVLHQLEDPADRASSRASGESVPTILNWRILMKTV